MVEAAEASGELTADKTILEPTSGNTGIALAMVSRRKGYALTVVIPDNASEERIGLLRLFGAEIVFSDGAKGTNGSIEVARALANDERYYMPFQYGNPANPGAHERGTAQEILRDLPTVTHFVAGMGTGGTLDRDRPRTARPRPEREGRRRGARAGRSGVRAPVAGRRLHPADLRSGADRSEVPGQLGGLAARHARADGARGHLRRDQQRRRDPRGPARSRRRWRRPTSSACCPTADGSTCPRRPGPRTSRRRSGASRSRCGGSRCPIAARSASSTPGSAA